MKTKTLLLSAVLLSGGLTVQIQSAHAQPDPNNAPKATNPAGQPNPLAAWGNPIPGWNKMTPQQREEATRKVAEQTLRGTMTWLGFDNAEFQDAIAATMLQQDRDFAPVREAHRQVAQALMENKLSDEQMDALLQNLHNEAETARKLRDDSIDALKQKVDFDAQPRLKIFLTMSGIIGNENAHLGGFLGNLTTGMTNLGVAQR